MVVDVGNTNADLFEDFARHGVLEALARLDETGEDRMLTGAPYGLAAEDAIVAAVMDQHDHGRVGTREAQESAIRVGTSHHMAGFAAFGRTAADPAEAVSVLPGRHGAGVGQPPTRSGPEGSSRNEFLSRVVCPVFHFLHGKVAGDR